MSAEFQSIEDQINASYQSASQDETMSRQLEARIAKIPGAKRHLPARQYGQPVDLGKIRSNLTLTSLIAQDSAELAYFCGIDPAIKHRQDEQKAAKAMRAESLRMQTDSWQHAMRQPVSNGNNANNSHRGNAAIRHEDQPDAPRL